MRKRIRIQIRMRIRITRFPVRSSQAIQLEAAIIIKHQQPSACHQSGFTNVDLRSFAIFSDDDVDVNVAVDVDVEKKKIGNLRIEKKKSRNFRVEKNLFLQILRGFERRTAERTRP